MEQQHSIERTLPPRHTEIGTVSLTPGFFRIALLLVFPTSLSLCDQSTVYPQPKNETFASSDLEL